MPDWSDEEKDWVTTTMKPRGGRVVPFGFDYETRLLTVLSDRSSPPATVAAVFERILRDNERELPEEERSTEWSVEPILDAEEFIEWLSSLEVVHRVSFTARLPNPEPRDAFRNLAERMEARRATEYTETLKSDREEGLQACRTTATCSRQSLWASTASRGSAVAGDAPAASRASCSRARSPRSMSTSCRPRGRKRGRGSASG